MKSKYVDTTAAVNVIAGVYNNTELLENEKYKFYEELFTEDIHKILFNSIYNLHALGAKEISIKTIEDYLETKPKKLAIYKTYNGADLLLEYKEKFKENTFDYYYGRLTKFCLLREYDKIGIDCKQIYDVDNIFDSKLREKQDEWLDNASLADITFKIENLIEEVKMKYSECVEDNSCHISEGIDELIESLATKPDFGYPLYGDYINTITRGARLGKLYLRSAATGLGKTRMMIADACNFGCSEMYDPVQKQWVSLGPVQPTLFISTEQTVAEIQTASLAFLSGVDEGHIVTNGYEDGERERVLKAAEILKNGRIIFESMPDFSLADIEATIKRAIRNHNVLHICYDYIHTSIKILEEITKMSGGVRLREDQILYMLGVRLKDLAVKYDVFIITATQLNGDYREAEVYDQNLLRGAKNLGDKIDFGGILLEASAKDKECLAQTCSILGIDAGDINNKLAIYKNRGNKHRGILAWIAADKGTCRYDIKFCTDYSYRLVEIPNIKIKVKEEGAFDKIRERF